MKSRGGNLEIRVVTPEIAPGLGRFLEELASAGDDRWFRPHDLDPAGARSVAALTGSDYYCVAMLDTEVVAYGMLRGWDEGYEIPSLGIAVHPRHRGMGLGAALMLFLHVVARERGAPSVRLTVDVSNETALRLYERLGYRFRPLEGDRMVGHLEFAPSDTPQVS